MVGLSKVLDHRAKCIRETVTAESRSLAKKVFTTRIALVLKLIYARLSLTQTRFQPINNRPILYIFNLYLENNTTWNALRAGKMFPPT